MSLEAVNVQQTSYDNQVPAGSTGTQATTGTTASDELLFEETKGATGTTGATETSATEGTKKASNAAQIQSLNTQLTAKKDELKGYRNELKINTKELKTANSQLEQANKTVESARQAFENAVTEWTAAETQLNQLESQNILSRLFNQGEINRLRTTVATLKAKAESAKKAYEKAQENQAEKAKNVEELENNNTLLLGLIKQTGQDIKDISQQLGEEVAKAEAEAEESGEAGETGATGNGGTTTTNGSSQTGSTGSGTGAAGSDDGLDPETRQAVQEAQAESQRASQTMGQAYEDQRRYDVYQERFDDDWFRSDYHDFSYVFSVFGFDFSPAECRVIGFGALGFSSQMTQRLEAELMSPAYKKSSGAALGDTATAKEHSEAEAEFMDVMLTVSDAFNSGDVEFIDLKDQSNFNMGMITLGKINNGEYIKTDLLKRQTTVAQGIQFKNSMQDGDKADEAKLEEYSEAMLDELERQMSQQNPFVQDGGQEDFQAVEARYNFLAATDPKAAFDYLEEEAGKYGITEAVAA